MLAVPLFGIHALASEVQVDEDNDDDEGEDAAVGERGQGLVMLRC